MIQNTYILYILVCILRSDSRGEKKRLKFVINLNTWPAVINFIRGLASVINFNTMNTWPPLYHSVAK